MIKYLTAFTLFLLSFYSFADNVRLVNKESGDVIYASPDQVKRFKEHYISEAKLVRPKYSVEKVDLQRNYAIQSRSIASKVNSTSKVLNDPWFSMQFYWESPTSLYYGHSDIASSHGTAIPLGKARIGIIDSGFWNNSDLTFSEGYNFVDISDMGLSPNSNYEMEASTDQERKDCGFAHGTGVASVIGATLNDIGIAGIVDADLIAGKALNCGTGYFSNVINAMDWMSGETVGSAPKISKPVDVINMSLGGIGDCSPYMQDSIDRMTAKGILVFTSAGNDSLDASKSYPSNCNGVITTTALTRKGELTSFANFGNSNNLGALGEDVYALGPEDGDVYAWSGTSFSAPISAAIAARTIARYPNVGTHVIKALLLQSSGKFNPSLNCESKGCGVGVVNATNLDNLTNSYDKGESFALTPALTDMPFCDKTKYFTFSGDKERLCDLTKVIFIDEKHYNSTSTYELYKVSKGEQLTTENSELVLSTNQREALLTSTDIDLTFYDYGFRICDNGTCKIDTLISANLSYNDTPIECQ
jgi:serine protease